MPLPDFDELFCVIDRPETVAANGPARRNLHGRDDAGAAGRQRLPLRRFLLLRTQFASFISRTP